MSENPPGWPAKMHAIQDAIHWAADRVVVVFRDSNQGGRVREANEVWLELHLDRIDSLGVDGSVDVEGADPNDRVPVMCGVRSFTMDVRAFSRSQEHDQAAWYALERARLRFRAPFVKDEWLKPANLAIVEAAQLVNLPKVWDQRVEDQGVLELRMATTVSDQDAAYTGTWIDRVLVSSTLKAFDGQNLDPALQLDNESMGADPPP